MAESMQRHGVLKKNEPGSRSVSFIQEIKYPPPWVQLDWERERWNLFNVITSWVKFFFFPEELSLRCCPDNCLSDKIKPNSLKLFWLLMGEIWKWESGVMRNCSYVGLTVIVCGMLLWYLLLGLSQWITSSKFKFAKQIK